MSSSLEQTVRDGSLRPFAVFDIDGTLIRWQLYHAIADTLAKKGYADAKAYQAVRDARMSWKRREASEAFKTYETHLVEFYNRLLENLSVEHFAEAAETVFEEYKDQVYVFSRELIKNLKRQNYLLFALSGSQLEIVEKIANYYGFDDFIGTTYERSGKYYTGNFIAHISHKDAVLKKLVARHQATYAGSIALGDSAGDISMLEAVQQAIAFNPERKLFDYAAARGWRIVVERKNMIYQMEDNHGQYHLVSTNAG
jgi:HAD superfamily hydrolase (TIGR01490 family)